jgi:hypothetical protein
MDGDDHQVIEKEKGIWPSGHQSHFSRKNIKFWGIFKEEIIEKFKRGKGKNFLNDCKFTHKIVIEVNKF